MKTTEIYDPIAETYIAHAENPKSWNNIYERPVMISLFDNFKDKNVLDVGAATGYYSFFAQKKGARVTSVDISKALVDYIKETDTTNSIKAYQADIEKGLPFLDDSSQDYIVCSLMIHYLKDWTLILKEFNRVLTPGGKVYISTHHPVADYVHLQKENYFTTEKISELWGSGKNRFKVQYYTRPLSQLFQPILDSPLTLIKTLEPMPPEKSKKINHGLYEHLSKKPGFLFLILEKKEI